MVSSLESRYLKILVNFAAETLLDGIVLDDDTWLDEQKRVSGSLTEPLNFFLGSLQVFEAGLWVYSFMYAEDNLENIEIWTENIFH